MRKRSLLHINYEVQMVSPRFRFMSQIFSLPIGALLACISYYINDVLILLQFLDNNFSPDSIGKLISWLVNSALNCAWKPISHAISKSTVKTVIALANKQSQGRSYTCTSCLFLHLFSNFLNKLRSDLKDKEINSSISVNLPAVGIVEKLFCSCRVTIWRQSLRRCETISLSLVFNSQFHAKYLAS